MSADGDIRRLLPDPPPPAPARREAAIAKAARRFGGEASDPRKPARAARPQRGVWDSIRRPQVQVIAAFALVAAISLPLARIALDRPSTLVESPREKPERRAAEPRMARLEMTAPATRAVAPPPSDIAAPAPAERAKAPPAAAPADADTASNREASADAAPAKSAPAKPAPPADRAAAEPVEIAVTAQARRGAARAPSPSAAFAPPPAAPRAPPPPPLAESNVVVTGAARARGAQVARGGWNACTIDDPAHDPARCAGLLKGGSAAQRRAARTHLDEGLAAAWQGDLDAAALAFDRAIDALPDQSIAYLNRGLVYARRDDLDRAMADLDRAVRHAPASASGYYHRARLWRRMGKPDRAAADEARAVDLDPRYKSVVR